MNWLDKYKPTNTSELLGDKAQFQQIDKFVKQFTRKTNKNIYPNLIVIGTNGIGKSISVDLILQENGLEKIVANLSNISVARKTKRRKRVEKEVKKTNRSIKTYYLSLKNNKKLLLDGNFCEQNIALVFDDVSNTSNPKEKEAIKAIVKMNNKYKYFPIILISNTKHSKMVNELRKMVTYLVKKTLTNGKKENHKIINEVFMKYPSCYEIDIFIKKICAIENLNLVLNKSGVDNIYSLITEHAQHDIRRLINILEELKLIYENRPVTFDNFIKYCESSKTKDLNPGIFEATRKLLNCYTNMKDALTIYGEERATIPLMVHENYPLNISLQYPKMTIDKQIDLVYDISKSISESDKVDGLIYSNQCWSLQPVHGFYSCVIPSFYINKTPGKLTKYEKYKYTQDYNKTSIKKINNKVIKKAQEHPSFKKVSINDFLFIATILKTLIENKEFEKVAELMKPYKLKLKEIESIIKIDKIRKTKPMLTGKQKTLLKEMLGVNE